MIQALPYGGFEYVNLPLKAILATGDVSEFNYFVAEDLQKTNSKKHRTQKFSLR